MLNIVLCSRWLVCEKFAYYSKQIVDLVMDLLSDGGSIRGTCLRIDDTVKLEKDMTAILTGPTSNINNSKKLSEDEDEGDDDLATLSIYKCRHCPRTFSKSNLFKSHCFSAHRVTHPFACSQCDKAYTYKNSLITHLMVHKNDRPFHCDECGKLYNVTRFICQ